MTEIYDNTFDKLDKICDLLDEARSLYDEVFDVFDKYDDWSSEVTNEEYNDIHGRMDYIGDISYSMVE